ncbi:hypothetical protein [Rhodoferax sp.]|uniref:hypothetical protein n=1 Tax=Rhodoferax sp. TaxID=50421 RepID=UPI00260E01A1|nr:hypothetical protein [Rhodoferax sp.]MDD5480590.1 hypothetical protein [Rhodoferax sp.]
MHIRNFLAITMLSTAFLAGCGGGGGGGTSPTPVSVASTATFPFFSIAAGRFNEAKTRSFTVSLHLSTGQVLTGTGTDSSSAPASSSFEGRPSLVKNFTTTYSYTNGSVSFPIFETSSAHYDSNYTLLGGIGSNYYGVVTNSFPEPQSAKIGDTGPLAIATTYSNSTKTTILGSSKLSYVFEPDTNSTAILKLISENFDKTNTRQSYSTIAYRVSTDGSYTLLSDTNSYLSGELRLKTLIYQ